MGPVRSDLVEVGAVDAAVEHFNTQARSLRAGTSERGLMGRSCTSERPTGSQGPNRWEGSPLYSR